MNKRIKIVEPPVASSKKEIWALSPLNTNQIYYVSSEGRMFSTARNRLLNLKRTGGYKMFFFIPKDDKVIIPHGRWKGFVKKKCDQEQVLFSRLVATIFCIKPKGCNVVIHLNYEKDDCRAENLQWVTQDGAREHLFNAPNYKAKKPGLGRGKLTAEQVREIKTLFKTTDLTNLRIAIRYDMSEAQIGRIRAGVYWNHIKE